LIGVLGLALCLIASASCNHSCLFCMQVRQLAEGPDAPDLVMIINPQWDERGKGMFR